MRALVLGFCLLWVLPAAALPPEMESVIQRASVEVGVGADLTSFFKREAASAADSVRKDLLYEMGWTLPGVHFKTNQALGPNEYNVSGASGEVWRASLVDGKLIAIGAEKNLAGLPGPLTVEPNFNLPAKWIEPNLRAQAEARNCLVYEPAQIFKTQLFSVCQEHVTEWLAPEQVAAQLALLQEVEPVLAQRLRADATAQTRLFGIMRNLLEERFPVRDFEVLAELVASSPSQDVDRLTESARSRLSEWILPDYLLDGTIAVTRVGPKLQAALARPGQGSKQILDSLRPVISGMDESGVQPILLTDNATRLPLRRLIAKEFPKTVVLAQGELRPQYPIRVIGTVDL